MSFLNGDDASCPDLKSRVAYFESVRPFKLDYSAKRGHFPITGAGPGLQASVTESWSTVTIFQPATQYSSSIVRPPCSKCGTQMLLSRIEPDKPDYDKRPMVQCRTSLDAD